MSRASEVTRQNLIEEAIEAFAAHGFAGASVRAITQKANANQAAINYHFGTKEGLYREVLRTSIEAFSERALLNLDNVDAIERDEAVRLFVRQQLQPLAKDRKAQRYVRIFAWESVAPSRVFTEYIATERIPAFALAERIVRRYLGREAPREEVTIKAIWLTGQSGIFIRNFANLSRPPANLRIDAGFIERLIETVAGLAIAALRGV